MTYSWQTNDETLRRIFKRLQEHTETERYYNGHQKQGNYFIIDSEQLVSRPYHDAQIDAQSDAQKRSSNLDKITNAKNNICDKHLHVLEGKLNREETTLIKNLNNTTNKLRFEVKKLDLDKQNNELDIKKRVDPDRDYSYDENQINTSSKRLGITGSAFYLNKKLKIPVRVKITGERVPPDVARAQDLLKKRKSGFNDRLVCSAPSRATNFSGRCQSFDPMKIVADSNTPNTVLGLNHGRREVSTSNYSWNRNSSDKKNETVTEETFDLNQNGGNDVKDGQNEADDQISETQLPWLPIPGRRPSKSSHSRVKFIDRPSFHGKNLDNLSRAKTFHGDLYENYDNFIRTPKIDIVAALLEKFPDTFRPQRPMTDGRATSRRKSVQAPRVTQKLMVRDSKIIQSKIEHFFSTVFNEDRRKIVKTPEVEVEFAKNKRDGDDMLGMAGLMSLYSQVLAQTATAVKETNAENDSDEFQAWMEIGRRELDEHRRLKNVKNGSGTAGKIEDDEMDDSQLKLNEKMMEKLAMKKWRELSWRLTKEGISKEYGGDISINRLMGIDTMGGNKKKISGIPVNSASRALRQSTTYKMQKLVDKLMRGKNKYEKYEVEELKRRLDEGESMAEVTESTPQIPAGPTRERTRSVESLACDIITVFS